MPADRVHHKRRSEAGFTLFSRRSEAGFTLFSRRSEAGFTLLEMMVALAIFSLAALSLMRMQSYSIASASDVRAHNLAALTLQNVAADFLSNPAPISAGGRSGEISNAGHVWLWQAEITPSPDSAIMLINLQIAEKNGNGRSALTISRPLVLP